MSTPSSERSELAPPPPQPKEDNRDLGFGSVVADESRERLLNRDGTFNVKRHGLGFFASMSAYHWLVTLSWPRFLLLLGLLLVVSNALFAGLYMACGVGALTVPADLGVSSRYWVAFFFSVQTFATIGYGQIAPVGMPANTLVALESYYSILLVALATGLIFARFSRPTARIRFSDQAIVAPYQGGTGLMLRLINVRRGELIDLTARLSVAFWNDEGGKRVRRFAQLELERDRVTFFPLAWTLVHPIVESSPLFGLTEPEFRRRDPEVLVMISGIDDTSEALVHARTSYRASEIAWGVKFASMFDPSREGPGVEVAVDVKRLSDVERVSLV